MRVVPLLACAIIAAVVALGAAAESAHVTQDEMKCQVCDYAARTWVRQAVRADVECRRLARNVAPDAQLLEVLPRDADSMPVNVAEHCKADGSGVSTAGVETIGAALCKELFLHEFPFVEEFPADSNVELDRVRQWESPAGYFETTPEAEGVEPMDQRDVDMLRGACEATLPVNSAKRRARLVASIRAAVEAARLEGLEERILTEKRDALEVVVGNAEAAAREGLPSGVVEDDESGEAVRAAADAAVAAERTRFLKQEKRQAVYALVLEAQREFCSAACDASIQRPPHDVRVRGWSATLRRL